MDRGYDFQNHDIFVIYTSGNSNGKNWIIYYSTLLNWLAYDKARKKELIQNNAMTSLYIS